MLELLLNPLTFLYDVRVANDGIQFVFLRTIVISTVLFENIDFIAGQKNVFQPWTAYRFVNRWISQRFVIYKKSSWFSKCVVVSLVNSAAFVEAIRRHGVIVKT